MDRFSKEKIIGIAGTVIVHVLLALLLYFLVLDPPPTPPEKGIEVMLGMDVENVAMAQQAEAAPVAPQPVPAEPAPVAPEEPLMTQESEESLALPPEKEKEEPTVPEKTPEEIQKEREEAERKEQERREAEAREAANNRLANAFSKGSSMSKKENTEKSEETMGSVQGNSVAGVQTGIGVSFSLEGRNPGEDGIIVPKEKLQAAGKVVVDITVNPVGKVIDASVNTRMTNTADLKLRNAALKAAKATIFNSIAGVDNQRGTITYNFELR